MPLLITCSSPFAAPRHPHLRAPQHVCCHVCRAHARPCLSTGRNRHFDLTFGTAAMLAQRGGGSFALRFWLLQKIASCFVAVCCLVWLGCSAPCVACSGKGRTQLQTFKEICGGRCAFVALWQCFTRRTLRAVASSAGTLIAPRGVHRTPGEHHPYAAACMATPEGPRLLMLTFISTQVASWPRILQMGAGTPY